MSGAGLKLISLIPGSGYGDSACEYAAAIARQDIAVNWYPTRDDSQNLLPIRQATTDVATPLLEQMAHLWNQPVDAEAFLLDVPPWRWHEYWLQQEPKLRPYCYLAWEVDRVPVPWIAPLNHFEKVFVPSTFNRNTLVDAGVTVPVVTVPHIARDISLVNDGPQVTLEMKDVRADDFVFYTIGAWTSRKNMESTICSYLEAFTADDRVVLVIKTEPVNQIERFRQLNSPGTSHAPHTLGTAWALAGIIARYPNAARIHLIAERITPAQIDQLHRRGDCFVSLTHSEGWGLGAFDAVQHGNRVITTGWGGVVDFLGNDYPLLVDYQLRATQESPEDGYFYRGAGINWAYPNQTHASQLMQFVFQSPAATRKVTRALQCHIREAYSASYIGETLVDEMQLTRTTA